MRHRLGSLAALGMLAAVLCPVSLAFENESLRAPANGERVSTEIMFYIDASGRPEEGEAYVIEVSNDKSFRSIVATYDMTKNKAGWSLGDSMGVDNVPEKYKPANFEGVHLRVNTKFTDGTYYWRAAKSTKGGAPLPLRGSESFVVDTLPPRSLDSLRLRLLDDGRLQLYWQIEAADVEGNYDEIAGFRVYRFDRVLKRYPVMTRNLLAELNDTQYVVQGKQNEGSRITFFLVQGVDKVGNEEGRRRPAPIGSLETAFNPPNADDLINKDNLKRMAKEDAGK